MIWSPCQFISGSVAGVCALMAGHPFDTVKTRMQVSNETSIVKVVREMYQNEGARGFLKGYLLPIISSGLLNAAYFGTYGNSLVVMLHGDSQFFCCEKGYAREKTEFHMKSATAGALGGIAAAVVGCPGENVKIKQQGNREASFSVIPMVKHIYQNRGIRGLYRGFVPMLFRNIIGLSSYVLTYEHVLCFMEKDLDDLTHPPNVLKEIISGGVAGCVLWTLAIPFDVIKSRIQFDDVQKPKYKGTIDCFRQSFKADGVGIFTKGLTMALIRAMPVSATTFVVYQFCMRHCITYY